MQVIRTDGQRRPVLSDDFAMSDSDTDPMLVGSHSGDLCECFVRSASWHHYSCARFKQDCLPPGDPAWPMEAVPANCAIFRSEFAAILAFAHRLGRAALLLSYVAVSSTLNPRSREGSQAAYAPQISVKGLQP
jgi:hypothetical protein